MLICVFDFRMYNKRQILTLYISFVIVMMKSENVLSIINKLFILFQMENIPASAHCWINSIQRWLNVESMFQQYAPAGMVIAVIIISCQQVVETMAYML